MAKDLEQRLDTALAAGDRADARGTLARSCADVLARLRHVATTEHRYAHRTIARLAERLAPMSRRTIAAALTTLEARGYVCSTHNPAGGKGRELWRACTDAEIATHRARAALVRELQRLLGEDHRGTDVGPEDLAKLLHAQADPRGRLVAACNDYCAAIDAEWCADGNNAAPATYTRPLVLEPKGVDRG